MSVLYERLPRLPAFDVRRRAKRRPSGGMADAGDLKSLALDGRAGSSPALAINLRSPERFFVRGFFVFAPSFSRRVVPPTARISGPSSAFGCDALFRKI